MGFIRINNRKAFLLEEIPVIHPASVAYLKFWREQKKRCIEGFWAQDTVDKNEKGCWRWMPPQLYFYANFCVILHQDEDGPVSAPKRRIRPALRDVEWVVLYSWIEARGFSGFRDDEKYSCCRALNNKNINPKLLPKSCFNKEGKLKEYTPAREYLRKLHDAPLGLPIYDNEAKNLMMLGSRGFGKDLKWDTVVHTEHGKKIINDIKIGDKIYGADGKLTTVLDRFDYNNQEQYEITLSDGRKITSGGGHLWGVWERDKYSVKELNDIKKDYLIGKRNDSRYFIQQNEPIQYPSKQYNISPYLLGAILGDGGITGRNIVFTTADGEMIEHLNKEIIDTYYFKKGKDKYSYRLIKKNKDREKNFYVNELESLGLMYHHTRDKFIPEQYLYGSVEQRLDLLRGLLDTDGYINSFGNIEFVTISKKLANNIEELARSLGIVVTKKESDYKVRLYLKTDLPVFKLQRKLCRINVSKSNYAKTNQNKLAIRKIEPIGIHKSVCIAVDNSDKLFIVNDFVVTHNSYMTADAIVLHEWIFDGAKEYTQESIDNPYTVSIFVGAANSAKSSETLAKLKECYDNMPGAYGKRTANERPHPWHKQISGDLSPNNFKNPWRHEYLKKVGGKWTSFGSLSKINHGIYTTANPEAAAGTRPVIAIIEEVGLLSNTLKVHGSNDAVQREGAMKFGSALYIGTGGNIKKIAETKIIFQNPGGFDFLEFDDEWENKGKIGLFIPAYYAFNQFKDENGNTDVEAAMKYIEKVRKDKLESNAPFALEYEMMNYPITPSEMFLNIGVSKFPVADILDRLAVVETNETLLESSWKVEFIINEYGDVDYKISDKHLIRDFPVRTGINLDAAMEVYEWPKRDKDGKIPYGRYIAAIDPVDDDGNTDITMSLQSMLILDTWTDRIVLEYTARPMLAEEFYEQTRRALIYYNAIINYENQKKGFFAHLKNKNSIYLLAPTPSILKDKQLIKKINLVGNTAYGTATNLNINEWADTLIVSWLLTKVQHNSNETTVLQTVKSVGLLKELSMYDGELNCDRISALRMLMVLREEMMPKITKQINFDSHKVNKDFWNKNFENYRTRNGNNIKKINI